MSTLAKDNNILNKPTDGRNSYFLVEDQSATDLLVSNGFNSKEFVKENVQRLAKHWLALFQEKQHHSSNHVTLAFKIKVSSNILDNIIQETYKLKLSFSKHKWWQIGNVENSIEKIKEQYNREIDQLTKENNDTKDQP